MGGGTGSGLYTDSMPRPDSKWVEKPSYWSKPDRSVVQIFDTLGYGPKAVAFTCIEGRNATGDARSRRIWDLGQFLEAYEPFNSEKVRISNRISALEVELADLRKQIPGVF